MITSGHPWIDFRNLDVDASGTQSWELWAKHDGSGLDVTVGWPEGIIAVIVDYPPEQPLGWTLTNLNERRCFQVAASRKAPREVDPARAGCLAVAGSAGRARDLG